MRDIPETLRHGPFTRTAAHEAGVSDRMLQGRRFVRLHPRVWSCRDTRLTWAQEVEAARLALPAHARLTGISRLQALGLDFGPLRPIRFVVEGELHLDLDGIFLHRTVRMPPSDDESVTPAAAFLAYCARARVVDAVKVGDWLLHGGFTSLDEIRALALVAPWRDGAHEALWVLDHLDARARSLPESEVRVVLEFAGLPRAEPNGPLELEDGLVVVGDLVYREHRMLVEYEGAQHQEERGVYVSDLDRYELLRSHDVGYVQVTRERLRHARTLAGIVYRELVRRGYDGPPPTVGSDWQRLFVRLSALVGPRRERARGRIERCVTNRPAATDG